VNNPLLEIESLPAFDRIAAADARPALEQVLRENRERLAELTSQPAPTFASLVVPVEELSYRLSRVWSPIGHLNAVANSAAMREAYNECIPLLTAYSSELGQNEDLQAGYAYVLRHERDELDPAQVKVVENALRDFRLAGVDLPANARPDIARSCSASHSWGRSSLKMFSTPGAPIRAASPTAPSLPACRECNRPRRRRREGGQSAGMALQARPADLHDHHDQRRKRTTAPRHL